MLLLKAFILGIVEGLTEFLPISSTGHLIIVEDLLSVTSGMWKTFAVFIQLGAILAVCWEYRKRLWHTIEGLRNRADAWRFWIHLGIAFIPAAVAGLLFHHAIKEKLFNGPVVAGALIVGALIIFWVEARKCEATVTEVDAMTWRHALWVGLAQVLSLVPGTSRSGATIIGGMLSGLSRKTATEFSFFLAIPIMFAATLFDLYKGRADLHADAVGLFAVGFVTSFVFALLAVRWLIRYVSSHDFRLFAWYRLVLGALVVAYWLVFARQTG